MMTIAEKIKAYNRSLDFKGSLPQGISIMNPYQNLAILQLTDTFYDKYYADKQSRRLILGINPGRLGAGATGIPFTDTKRLQADCAIPFSGFETHEPSSVFVYDVIAAYGGVAAFYSHFYINSVCPLGFTKTNERGAEVNYNYYDSRDLTEAVYAFIVANIEQLLHLGFDASTCFCLGMGENFKFLNKLNRAKKYFGSIVPLDHPRFVMQYRLKSKEAYVAKYCEALTRYEGF